MIVINNITIVINDSNDIARVLVGRTLVLDGITTVMNSIYNDSD